MGGSAAIFAAPDPRSGLAGGLVSPCMGALPEQLTHVDLPAAKSLLGPWPEASPPPVNLLVAMSLLSDTSTVTLPTKRNLRQVAKQCRQLRSCGNSPRGGVVFAEISLRGGVVTGQMIPPLSHLTPAKTVVMDAALQQDYPLEQRSVTTAPPVDLQVSKSTRGWRPDPQPPPVDLQVAKSPPGRRLAAQPPPLGPPAATSLLGQRLVTPPPQADMPATKLLLGQWPEAPPPPVDLLVVASPLGQRPETQPTPARGLAVSRLAYYDLPTFTLLQSESSGLVETGDPMAYIGDLDGMVFTP